MKMAALITFQFGIVLVLSRILIGHGFTWFKQAELTPVDPFLEAGDTLVLNCTLTQAYNGTYNASDIYFDHSGRNYSSTSPYVQTLSNVTAQLRLPNITVDMNGLFRCSLPGIYLGAFASQSVHVVRRPLQPVLDGCVVYNWERMECSWSPSRSEQGQHTQGPRSFVQTLFYRHPGDESWKRCPQDVAEKCIWPASQFKMGATYCIQINVTNILRHVVASSVTCVQAQTEIVKPNPPENVEPSFSSDYDGHVTLHWTPPTSTYMYKTPLVYHLAVQHQWQNQVVNFTVDNATSTRFRVISKTNYTVRISVRPSNHGFSSDNAVRPFETPATVPCKNPDSLTNAFFLVKDSRKVVLYWQPIALMDSCGPSLSYEVRAGQAGGATDSADLWRPVGVVRDSSAEVTLRGEEDAVALLSKNSIGVATHLPYVVIRVPSSLSETSVSSNYRLAVEGDSNSVTVQWSATAPMENVTGYTLFWCPQQSVARICKTPIQWQNLSDEELEYNLTLSGDYLRFQVGLAVNFLSGFTTGIIWADKLYSMTAKVDAPRILDVVASYSGSHGELDITWTPAPCVVKCAYIQTFVIFYCLADQHNNCHGDIESVRVASWSSSYSLVNLEHGSVYRIWMTSVARTGSSRPSDPICAATTKSWVTAGTVAGIVIAILCVATITIGGLYIILRRLNRYRKKFVNGLNIALPPTQRVQIPSTSSEVPMLGTKFDYNRQESVRSGSSGDSGRYSLTPASPAMLPLLSKLRDANENLDSFVPENYSMLAADTKAEDDEYSTRNCVLSYTIPDAKTVVPNGAPKSVSTLPNDASKMGNPANPRSTAGQSKYILPEQVEHLEMFQMNPWGSDRDVNYCTSFSFPPPSTAGNAVDIGYTKIENLQPLYDMVDQLPSPDAVEEQAQDSDLLHFDTSQDEDEAEIEESNSVPAIDQLIANLNAGDSLVTSLQIDEPATNKENEEPKLPLPSPPPSPPPPPRPVGDDSLFRGYAKIANTDFPNPSCSNVQSNWGYVDHAMFDVDSVA